MRMQRRTNKTVSIHSQSEADKSEMHNLWRLYRNLNLKRPKFESKGESSSTHCGDSYCNFVHLRSHELSVKFKSACDAGRSK
jgi:hypothetical protein